MTDILTAEQLQAIRERHSKATPGPYRWIMRTKTHQCQLVTDHSGQYYVMQFERWGMQDACPVFQEYETYEGKVTERHGKGMTRSDKLAKPIGGLAYRIGHEEYIDHPDAIALEKSWEDVESLLAALDAANARADKAIEDLEWLAITTVDSLRCNSCKYECCQDITVDAADALTAIIDAHKTEKG
jgi:hypothetical protein